MTDVHLFALESGDPYRLSLLAALMATDSANLVCSTMSSTSSSQADMGNLAGEQPLFGQHDDAVQGSPDLSGRCARAAIRPPVLPGLPRSSAKVSIAAA